MLPFRRRTFKRQVEVAQIEIAHIEVAQTSCKRANTDFEKPLQRLLRHRSTKSTGAVESFGGQCLSYVINENLMHDFIDANSWKQG